MKPDQAPNRRDFLKTTSAAAITAAAVPSALRAHAGPARPQKDRVRAAIVGIGGRGGGVCNDTLRANDNVELVAIADLDKDKAIGARDNFKKRKYSDRVTVQNKDIFTGLDGYEKVLARRDVDLVMFATPPGFRPSYIKAAVDAKKHIFAEKPVCVDPVGYRICCEAHDQAKQQGTAIVTGTQYRRQTCFVESIKRLHAGIIGDIVAMTARYCSGGIWYRPRKPGMTDMEYQIHNWMHFVWLSGDQIAEQAVHNIDVMNWVMQSHPESCYGSGGRFFRPKDSEMWDSVSVDYVYPGNRLASFTCRQLALTDGDNDNVIYCEGGIAYVKSFSSGAVIYDDKGKEVFKTKSRIGDAYQQEHKDLVTSIVAGKPIVELRQTAESSLTAVMGRMSAYTGKKVSWDFVTKQSQLDLFPKKMSMDAPIQSPGFAQPGKTKLI